MSHEISIGSADLVTHLKVTKKDGRTFYYEVRDEVTSEITEAAYLAATTLEQK